MDAEAVKYNEVSTGLLARRGGHRNFVPLSRSFLQERRAGGGAASLSSFVKARRKRALNLYLLCHAFASTEPYDVALSARTWALALGLEPTPSSRVFVSGTFSWLEKNNLVRTQRDGQARRVWLLDESGSGAPYVHDAGDEKARLDYFKLPYVFWFEGWDARLDLSAIAVLLIALSLPSTFSLPQERGGEWYGVSRDTIRRGIRTLHSEKLLSIRSIVTTAPQSPTGRTEQRRYKLAGPFARPNRLPRRRPPAKSAQ